MFELSDGTLTSEEQCRIQAALELEGKRLRNVPINIDFLGERPHE